MSKKLHGKGGKIDEERFPELIRRLYSIVKELEKMCDRPFTPDGHMVGSIGECLVSYYYDVELFAPSNQGHDGKKGDLSVEIKATQGKQFAVRSQPQHLIAIVIDENGGFEEVYNGPGSLVWDLVKDKKLPPNGQYSVSARQLKDLMKSVPVELQVPRRDMP